MPLTITEEMIRQDPFFQEGLEDGFRREHQRIVMSLYKKGKSFVFPQEKRMLNLILTI